MTYNDSANNPVILMMRITINQLWEKWIIYDKDSYSNDN